ncbi:39S ribosomal protein L22, mitochondrial [Belonocnema kinseyi]|uniref:39S ribosomal protein L22, mitochondrial n=1 Tax=Belonocnema kinseyi TaxID=2817044 RepID=UPI00143DAE0C|nr:39S ribosomal protein L22, mitochondrial [Belonocnema kinseyi]
MQSLTKCVRGLLSGTPLNQFLQPNLASSKQIAAGYMTRFEKHNEKFYPIQAHGEERRPAFVCHVKRHLKYSPKNMWYVANLVRGMSVDEALKQISFVLKKGGAFVKEAIEEAQEMAVKDHNVEFKSNLWVSESFVTKGRVIKGLRRHAKQRHGEIRYIYCHYYVTLEEGKPPENYYLTGQKTKEQLLEDFKEGLRKRKVYNSL